MTSPNYPEQPQGPVLALDLGQKRVGVAISDELLISITRLKPITRTNWKQLVRDVSEAVRKRNARTLVIGLPLSLDGTAGTAAKTAQEMARRFAQVLSIPVFLQDERLTTVAAAEQLRAAGRNPREMPRLIDSEAAAVILTDFVGSAETRTLVSREETS